jgi:hypothetical protein
MLTIMLPPKVWKEALSQKGKLKVVIEYDVSDSLHGLRFEKYYDYPSASLKEYVFTEAYVL